MVKPVEFVYEPERNIPVVSQTDVLVCGGGPAGWAAAVSAAGKGASVRLIEAQGQLGGVWTSGLLSYVLDAGNKKGFLRWLTNRLSETQGHLHFDRANRVPWTERSFFYDPEVMKLVLEESCQEAGVEIRLHTRVVSAIVEYGRLTHAITESKSGREAWGASVFIDATGDGDLAAHAGCRFSTGHPDDGATQPMSLVALLTGPPPDVLEPNIYAHNGHTEEAWDAFQKALVSAGSPPSYSKPVLGWIRDNLYVLMANHAYGNDATNAESVTRATLLTRQEVHQQVRALNDLGGAWSEVRLVATASQIGIREARRIEGRYTITSNDLLSGQKHPDAVCTVTFPVDVHATTPDGGKGFSDQDIRSQPYDIPLRALIAADVDGLMMAGRCISGDFWAHASYRVSGNAVAMGEAAGKVAAIAAKSNRLPHQVKFKEVT